MGEIWWRTCSSYDRCIKMPQCELSITTRLLQANLLGVRSQTTVRQGLCIFCLLINITDNWLMYNTGVHVSAVWPASRSFFFNKKKKNTSIFTVCHLCINVVFSHVLKSAFSHIKKDTVWNFWLLVALLSNVFTDGWPFCLFHSDTHGLKFMHAIYILLLVSSYSADGQ